MLLLVPIPTAPKDASANPAADNVCNVFESSVFTLSPTTSELSAITSDTPDALAPNNPVALSLFNNSPAVCKRPFSSTASKIFLPLAAITPSASSKPLTVPFFFNSIGSWSADGISMTVPDVPASTSITKGTNSPVKASTPRPLATPSPCNRFTPVLPAINIT